MIRAFSRWLFMRTHRRELLVCARYVRGQEGMDGGPPVDVGRRAGMLDAIEILGLLES